MKFKVGDRVRIKDLGGCAGDNITIGEIGTILDCCSGVNAYRVKFDNYNIGRHGCGRRCREGYGWNCTEEMLEPAYADGGIVTVHDALTHEIWTTPFVISKDKLDALVNAWAKLGCTTFNLVPDRVKEVIKKTEEKKMPTKFTFYVTEGTRIDKSCNKTVPTMTTFVSIGRYHSGKATCDKVDYDERQGCLEAIANAFLDGNFDREFNKAVKKNERTELHNRTCTYCGKVFDTVEELKEHEAWHVERKKARRERYLLRKRAKEIAFEEAAQKLAKEIKG